MEEKRKRGRPRIDTKYTENLTNSHRVAVNWHYAYEGIGIIKEFIDEIPDSNLIWHSDDETQSADFRLGIVEQIGRMYVQDHNSVNDCVAVAKCSTVAIKAGHTTREVEKAIRALRKAMKEFDAYDKSPEAETAMNNAYYALCDLGEPKNQ